MFPTVIGGRADAEAGAVPRLVLVADLGAARATVAITDLTSRLLAIERVDLDVTDGPGIVLPLLVSAWRRLLRQDHAPLAGAGIGLSLPVDHAAGGPDGLPTMHAWNSADISALLTARLGVPVLVDNGAHLMALGERRAAFPDVGDMIVVKVADGIEAGLICNGALHRGSVGAAGNLGHIRAPSGVGRPCRCGNTGCLEAVAAGPAVAAHLTAHGTPARSTEDVARLVRAGSLDAGRAVRRAGREIGEALADAVSLFNPSLIVLGGPLAEAGDVLLTGVRESVYRRSAPLSVGGLRIVASRTGDHAVVLGAAAMVADHVLLPRNPTLPGAA